MREGGEKSGQDFHKRDLTKRERRNGTLNKYFDKPPLERGGNGFLVAMGTASTTAGLIFPPRTFPEITSDSHCAGP